MRPLLLSILLCCPPVFAVVQQGYVLWTTNGAVSYSIWAWPLGATNYLLLGTTNKPPFAVASEQGTRLYLKGNYPLESGQCCVESDLGFVITPPQTNTIGTNQLRFTGPVNALLLQSAPYAGAPWQTIGVYTNTPLQLQLRQSQMLRTLKTNLPPLPPQ